MDKNDKLTGSSGDAQYALEDMLMLLDDLNVKIAIRVGRKSIGMTLLHDMAREHVGSDAGLPLNGPQDSSTDILICK